MNEQLYAALSDSNLSIYQLAAKSGIPYTTAYRLVKCRLDINKVSVETIARISAALGRSIEELMNPVCFIAGRRGSFHKVRYVWEFREREGLGLLMEIGQETIFEPIVTTIVRQDQPELYDAVARLAIRKQLRRIKFEKEAVDILKRRLENGNLSPSP